MLKKVYAAEYCSCVYESGFELISLHSTISGAYRAMKEHKINQYDMESLYSRKRYTLEKFERWRFRVIELKE